MPGSKGQKAVHACMIRLLNLGPAKHEEGVICVANQRIPNVCRIAGAACCGAIRGHQLGAKDLLTPTSYYCFLNNSSIFYCFPADSFVSMVRNILFPSFCSIGIWSGKRFLPSLVLDCSPLLSSAFPQIRTLRSWR